MVRPSSLSIARYCQLAPALSERFPSRSEATDRGNLVDQQVTAQINDGVAATDPDALAVLAWVDEHMGPGTRAQVLVPLHDPDTGGLLTRGTADLVKFCKDSTGKLIVGDMKKREQWLAGRLAAPDANLQTHAYALGEAAFEGAMSYQTVLILFGDGEVEALWSEVYTRESWVDVLEEIRAIQDQQSETPVATSGPHCLACYPRIHCPAWTLPAHQGPTELEPLTKPGGLTVENFGRALMAKKALDDVAELVGEQLKAFADANGGKVPVGGGKVWGQVMTKGRETIDAKALEADGLKAKYTRRGSPYPMYRLTNDKGAR
jgi:CRISPR/Cas system-associated exonuclease Cas4 (RecB family)